jgi:hypothetical protein
MFFGRGAIAEVSYTGEEKAAEINKLLADVVSALLLAPEKLALIPYAGRERRRLCSMGETHQCR